MTEANTNARGGRSVDKKRTGKPVLLTALPDQQL